MADPTRCFAVQHVPSGKWLPGGRGRATSRALGARPRLYNNRGAAEASLSWWLEGSWGMTWYDGEPGGLCCDPRPERRHEDFVIVEFGMVRS
jgi:hypothetical protein